MINLMREIDKQKQQDSQCNYFYRKPHSQEHTMKLNNADTFNEKIRYFNLGEEQDFKAEGCEWNNKLVTDYICDKKCYSQYTGNQKGTNTSNLTSMNWDLNEGELQDCDYMNRDFHSAPPKYGSEVTYNASEIESLNMCPESLLIKDLYNDIKSEPDCNKSTVPSVAKKVPFMLKRKSCSDLSCYDLETNVMNSPSLFLSNEVTNMEPTENKNVMSEESQNFKECMDKVSRLGLESNFQSISCYSGINYLSMTKENSDQSTNQNPFHTAKQSDSPNTVLNSDFNPILDLDCANRHFQMNSEFFPSNGPSGSNVEISHGRNEVSKSNFNINVDFTDRIYKHNYLASNESSKLCSFFDKHQVETFESAFQCVPQYSYSNFESDNAAYPSSSISSPKVNSLEGTNVYKKFNNNLSSDHIKTSEDVSFSMKRASGLDSNSKVFSLIKHSESAIKFSDTMCSRHDTEKSFSKEIGKCQVFKNGCKNSNEIYLSNGKRNSKSENFDFQYPSQNEFYVSLDENEVKSTNQFVSYNTDDYKFFNSSFDCKSNVLQHSKLKGFNESKEIKKGGNWLEPVAIEQKVYFRFDD
ncbi:hypothetical protein TNIN_469461 [Trichonephila inaurata madagascariensis]|uniref:Uncharacterized protein n=1 Tax=Trichonephila inaurata madagascariensis TaxID=2747483 RepID=A0A8X7CHP6_9ARAC|nr:hypothetical protein TNIN_469461 [Trichonephila inaurata madagascariensis]